MIELAYTNFNSDELHISLEGSATFISSKNSVVSGNCSEIASRIARVASEELVFVCQIVIADNKDKELRKYTNRMNKIAQLAGFGECNLTENVCVDGHECDSQIMFKYYKD